MGTRGTIAMFDENGRCLHKLYNSMDSYPDGLGVSLSDFFSEREEGESFMRMCDRYILEHVSDARDILEPAFEAPVVVDGHYMADPEIPEFREDGSQTYYDRREITDVNTEDRPDYARWGAIDSALSHGEYFYAITGSGGGINIKCYSNPLWFSDYGWDLVQEPVLVYDGSPEDFESELPKIKVRIEESDKWLKMERDKEGPYAVADRDLRKKLGIGKDDFLEARARGGIIIAAKQSNEPCVECFDFNEFAGGDAPIHFCIRESGRFVDCGDSEIENLYSYVAERETNRDDAIFNEYLPDGSRNPRHFDIYEKDDLFALADAAEELGCHVACVSGPNRARENYRIAGKMDMAWDRKSLAYVLPEDLPKPDAKGVHPEAAAKIAERMARFKIGQKLNAEIKNALDKFSDVLRGEVFDVIAIDARKIKGGKLSALPSIETGPYYGAAKKDAAMEKMAAEAADLAAPMKKPEILAGFAERPEMVSRLKAE